VVIPSDQNIYHSINTTISGVFLERKFNVRLLYKFDHAIFTLELTSRNEKHSQELIDALKLYVDKAMQMLDNDK
jgi:hypothetical protein